VRDETTVRALGFCPSSGGQAHIFELPVGSDAIKSNILLKLQDAGFAFSQGREWCPAEVFEWLRNQGLAKGPFKSIAWKGPGQWVQRNEP
jgi:hypothetical protein